MVVFKEGQKVLVIQSQSAHTKSHIEDVQCRVGSSGLVQHTLPESLANQSSSSFDVVQFVDPINFTKVDLDNVLRILRPSGVVFITCLALSSTSGSNPAVDQAHTSLKLNGFIQTKVESLAAETVQRVQLEHPELLEGNALLCSAEASKPAYEVGDSMPLKLASKSDAVKAWTLNANDMLDDDIDVLDSDVVLDAIDLKKPDPTTLKAAACTVDTSDAAQTKRKACKNCTCGLAEELEGEKEQQQTDTAAAKSSCGSCYLGDAFRCSSCPYRGMPAFKPGEKVQLSVTMDDDI